MNVNFELYRVFYTVANLGNITKASEELNISQPAISKAIKNLENQLGGQLFIRTKRGVTLTCEGQEFFYYIKQAIEYINNAENKFTDLINLESGTIKIGINATLTKEFLIPYLKEFHEVYPKINIQIITNRTGELIQKLKNGLLDMVILNLKNNNYGNDIQIIKCSEVHDIFVVGSKYKNLCNDIVSIKDVVNYPLILLPKGSNTRFNLDNFCKDLNIILTPNIELSSYALLTEFTKIGFGIGYTTKEFIKNELLNSELFELKIKEKIPSRYIGIALSKNHLPNFSTKKLIEIIKNSQLSSK